MHFISSPDEAVQHPVHGKLGVHGVIHREADLPLSAGDSAVGTKQARGIRLSAAVHIIIIEQAHLHPDFPAGMYCCSAANLVRAAARCLLCRYCTGGGTKMPAGTSQSDSHQQTLIQAQ
jgi:hypothetical protein